MKFAVVIPSVNRAAILKETLDSVFRQTLLPGMVVVATRAASDLPAEYAGDPRVRHLLAEGGLCAQNNAALRSLDGGCEWVTLLDDDMELAPDYFAAVARVFAAHPETIGFIGELLANGGIDRAEARRLAEAAPQGETPRYVPYRGNWGGLYGCNMNFRGWVVQREKFDENLPLYAEFFEVDYGFRVQRLGEIGYGHTTRAVHLQAKSGRINDARAGFSQIFNAYYLARKKVFPFWPVLFRIILRMPLVNLGGLLFSRKPLNRVQRLKGNLFAWACIVAGKTDPRLISRL